MINKFKQLVVDLETNGLLQEVTRIHCISVVDLNSSWSKLYLEKDVSNFIKLIDHPEVELIGHNIFNYDLKVLEKLLGWKPHKGQKIHDTMLLAQIIFADLKNEDTNNSGGWQGKIFSKRDTGSHSLRAWGQRIHQFKGDYEGGWGEYNDDMGRYCIGDTYTTKGLFEFLTTKIPEKLLISENQHAASIDLEYSIAPILARQQAYGVLYDTDKSRELITTLTARLVECRWTLQDLFKPRLVADGKTIIPKMNLKRPSITSDGRIIVHTIVKGRAYNKLKLQEFNPGSRQQIISRLINEWNWNPEEFTDTGRAKMNEDIIDALPFKGLEPLKEYLTINKRLSQIEGGKQAWINKIDKDGRIRGAIRQNGAVTGRMAHFSPNLAQVPANDSLFGKECRELFCVPSTKIMLGCDADALEMRCLAGYLYPLDNGLFMQSLLAGNKDDGTDPHSINAEAMGIDREAAKTVFYAFIYGAKNAKIGKILLESGVDFNDYVPDFRKQADGMINWAAINTKNDKSRAYWECWTAGKQCLALFGDKLPHLITLKEKIHARIKEVGFIKGLDGRKLFCRSEHGELNTVLQSAGAIIMKKALYIADTELQEAGFIPGKDYEFLINCHDEFQIEVDKNVNIQLFKTIIENSVQKSGEYFAFPCPMKANSRLGSSWAETH